MGNAEANVRLVRESFEIFQRDGVEATLPLASEDIECYTAPELGGGSYRGHAGLLEWTSQWLESFDDYRVELANLAAVGERHVVADMRQMGRGRTSGVPVELRLAAMWEWREGKAVRYHLYPDRAVAVAEARRGESRTDE